MTVFHAPRPGWRSPLGAAALAVLVLGTLVPGAASAQTTPMQCGDAVAQDPTRVFRGGLWKQWLYWAVPGPSAYAAIQRVVAEVNAARSTAGLPLLVSNPAYEIVVSVFDERNARGVNGSSTYPVTANQEAFLAVFVDDSGGGSELLFLTDPLRSNVQLAARGVPGTAATVEYSVALEASNGSDRVSTRWEFRSDGGDSLVFRAHYPADAVYFRGIAPAARTLYANCNLVHSADIVHRSAPTALYALFSREESNYVDLSRGDVEVKVKVHHRDPLVRAIFGDPANLPEVLIGLDRDVRIERR